MAPEEILKTVRFHPDFDPSYGFECRRVSFFDHFLSLEEADSCTFIFYKLAIEKGSLSDFFIAEKRLLGLWARFAISGRIYGLNGKPFEIQSLHEAFNLGANVIRETSGYPVFFSKFKVIWEPASDLTHLLWLPKTENWDRVESLVREAGLHFLE